MLERIVYQLADHPVEDHLHVRIVTFGAEVGREADLHVVHGRTLVDEIPHAPRQSEIVEHVRRKVVRNLAQRADRLLDHIGRIVDDLALLGAALVARKGRQRHLRRREQRTQPVVQLLRETRPGLLLGTQHGRQDALVEQRPLVIQAVDILEELVRVHHPDRQADRHRDAQVGEPPARNDLHAHIHEQLHQPLDGQQREAHDEEYPHGVVLRGTHQPQGIGRRQRLDDDRDDEQDLDEHNRGFSQR